MNLENIRKIWVMIGTILFALNADWIPDIIKGVFSATGTELVFAAIGAIVALYQFVKARAGQQPEALTTRETGYWYILNPFKSV